MFDFKSFELEQGVTGRHSCTFRMTWTPDQFSPLYCPRSAWALVVRHIT